MKRFIYTTLSIICLLLTLFLMLVFSMGRQEIKDYPDAPRRMTLQEAVEMFQAKQVTPWVWLTDVEPDCERMARGTRSSNDEEVTLFIARDASRGRQVVIEASGHRSCNQIRPDDLYGVLRRVRDTDYTKYHKRGLVLADNAAPQWALCGECGPSHSKNGLILAGIIIALFGGLTIYFFWARNRD